MNLGGDKTRGGKQRFTIKNNGRQNGCRPLLIRFIIGVETSTIV
jgi:hypothetical protein